MADEESELERILENFDETSDSESNSGSQFESNTDRLEKLRDEGVISEEEYQMLQSRRSESDGGRNSSSPESEEFGRPIVTSEGADMDFSIVGVIEDVDTTNLTLEFGDDGGPGRTLVFWQIHNHSNEEILLKHKHLEHVGVDKIAYNQDGNPLDVEKFDPGWRTEDWQEIAADTRIKYVSCVELPVQLGAVKVNGYCSKVHDIGITDEMFFPKSEAPVKVDI